MSTHYGRRGPTAGCTSGGSEQVNRALRRSASRTWPPCWHLASAAVDREAHDRRCRSSRPPWRARSAAAPCDLPATASAT